jgi:DNA/RNA-binding domain of Phe-tRNA-synthetase-like protein
VYFQHASEIWRDYPDLVAGAAFAEGIGPDVEVDARIAALYDIARERLAGSSESGLPEVQAWRRTFSRMGLEPTKYRSASESLLRRFRKEGELPRIHPLIDLCNAVSLAFAVPVAVFDVSRIAEHVEVRPARGDETYETFSGEIEHPEAGEVIFADAAGRAHARRWTNRQSGYSAVRDATSRILIVAEALHPGAREDVARLVATVAAELEAVWSTTPSSALLSASSPRFEL